MAVLFLQEVWEDCGHLWVCSVWGLEKRLPSKLRVSLGFWQDVRPLVKLKRTAKYSCRNWRKFEWKLGAKMMHSWCKVGAKLVHSWCKVGAFLVPDWCKVGAFLVPNWCKVGHSWCKVGAFLVQSWCILGAKLVHSWCKVWCSSSCKCTVKGEKTLHQHCTNFATRMRQERANFAPRMRQLCANFAPRMRRLCAKNAPRMHQSFFQLCLKPVWTMTQDCKNVYTKLAFGRCLVKGSALWILENKFR